MLQRGSVPASNFDPTGKLGNVDPTLPTTPKTSREATWKQNANQLHGQRTADDLSKIGVVPDEQGFIRLYRGSNNDKGVIRSSSYLTDNANLAKQYGKVEEVRLKPDEIISNGEFTNTKDTGYSFNNILELKKNADGTYTSIADNPTPTTPKTEVPKGSVKPIGKPKAEKQVGDTVSGNSARIEQIAIEKRLTDSFGNLPQFKGINMKEQAKLSSELILTDRQGAIDIIDGRKNPPGNLKAQSVHQALEEVATREGDVNLLLKLARSNINTELSESAQNLRIAAERNPHGAVENIRKISDARLKNAEKRSKTTIKKESASIKKQVEARTPKQKKEDWASFAESLVC